MVKLIEGTKSIGGCPNACANRSAKDARLMPTAAARLSTVWGAAGFSNTSVTARTRRGSWSAANRGD